MFGRLILEMLVFDWSWLNGGVSWQQKLLCVCVCVCVCVFMCHLPVVSAHCPRRQKRSAVAPGSGWLTRLKLMAPVIMKSNRSHDEQEEEVEATQRT